MGIPRGTRTIPERLKLLEQENQRLRGDLAALGFAGTLTTPGNAVAITSATWVEAFTVAGKRQNTSWEIRFKATAAAGTTGEVRAVVAGTSTELKAPVSVGDGQTIDADWIIELPGNFDDYTVIEIQAQRLTGSGSITVRPYSVAGG